ncbi:PP16A phosphatase, partial [Polypterus senegalus]
MVELLVANGANLNAKSYMDETPLDVCADDEVRAKLLDLKRKHDAIMKSEERHKSSLQRRASSAGSRGKVVRRVSVNERSSLYRREHQKEAIVWQERGQEVELQDDDEDKQTDAELKQHTTLSSANESHGNQVDPMQESLFSKSETIVGNGSASSSSLPGEPRGSKLDRSASYQMATGAQEDAVGSDLSKEVSHHTLADLKRQRAAAKLHKQSPLSTGEDLSQISLETVRSNTESTVYCTPASGDPPLLKLIAPEEDPPPEKNRCCSLM